MNTEQTIAQIVEEAIEYNMGSTGFWDEYEAVARVAYATWTVTHSEPFNIEEHFDLVESVAELVNAG